MINKLKTTTLAVVTAAATLLGSGQAWALDVTYDNIVLVTALPAPGCDGATLLTTKYFDGTNNVITVGVTSGSSSADFVQASFTTSGALISANVIANSDTDPFFGFNFVELLCTNLSNVTTVSANTITDAGAYASASFVGNVFDADDSNDSLRYRYTVGFEGVTNTQPVFRRALLDATAPSVTLSSTTTTLAGTAPFTVTATFDEDVTGFDDLVNDITIANGTVTGITAVSATVYTLNITPTGVGDVSITVPAAAAQDLASNDNTASNTLVIGNTIVADTQKAIAGFMLGRANNLASNQPGLTRFLTGEGCGPFSASANENAGSVNGCASSGNTWAEISSSWGGGNSYTLGTVGAHGFVNPDFLVGGMLQFDNAKDDANNASGTGWMVGPYFAAKVPDQPLFFEGRLLYGQTDNKISPLGTFTDSFKTERMLAQLRATGEYKLENTTLMPLFDLTYTDDAQKTYTDSLGNTIPGQKVALTQVTAGMDFKTPLPSQSGALDLTGGLSGIYASTQNGAAAQQDFEGGRGRVHLGLNYTTGTGATLNVGTFYDGIGSKHEAYGASLGFNWKF